MDITEQQNELIEANGGKASPELAAQLLEQALNGDTATPAETGGVPDTTQVQTEATPPTEGEGNTQNAGAQAQQQPIDESQLNAENAVVMAKDGKHTIPFEKLVEARSQGQEWKQKFDEAQQQLAHLRAEAQQRQEEGQAATLQDNQANLAQQAIDQGVDPAIFGDFSEKDLAAGIQKLVDDRVAQMVDQRVNAALSPMHQQQQISAEQAHFNEIFTAHPDAESIVESQEFGNWISKQPSFVQSAYEAVLNQGNAAQVVELLGLYKAETQSSQAAQPNNDAVMAAAKQAVKQAQSKVPYSVTDFPSGSPTGQSHDERLSNLSGPELLAEMSKWTSDQIEAYYARNA